MGRSSLTNSKLDLDLEKYDLDDLALEKLNLNNQRIIKGTEDIITTPLVKNSSVEEVISGWNKVFHENNDLMNDFLKEIESKQKDKISARSQAKPWSDNKDSLYDYFNRDKPSYTYKPVFKSDNVLRPISISKAVDFLKNSTSAGLPSMLKTGDIKDKLVNESYLKSLLSVDYPCVLFTRTQESWKTRYVWGYPKSNALNEMKYYKPLQAVQKKMRWRSALVGPEATDEAMTRMINFAVHNNLLLLSVDFTAYDSSVSELQINNAFDYIKSLFQSKYHSEIDKISDYFKTCGIISPDGVIEGLHGIPSGSVFTNEVGSIVQHQIYDDTDLVYMDYIQCQGDDGVFPIDENFVDELFNSLSKYDKIAKLEKSHVDKHGTVFLQNVYHIDYMKDGLIGGIYPTYRALCRLIYQERWSDFEKYGIDGSDYYSIRTIQLLENCKFHPLFEEFVKYIYSLDKYKLAYSDEGLSKMIRMISDKQGKSGIVDNQYGDNLKGIANFATTKVLLRLNN